MIGLEYLLHLHEMAHMELAEKLGIKKQNINLWIKGKQNIPKKHLPKLAELFDVDASLLQQPLTDLDKLHLQRDKLERELEPVKLKKIEEFSIFDSEHFLKEKTVYDEPELNRLTDEIDEEQLADRFKELIKEPLANKDTVSLFIKLVEESPTEPLLHKTLEGLAHYFDILPAEISTEPEQEEFEEDLFEVFDDHNY